MTELRIEELVMPAADLGRENPLPMFRGTDDNIDVKMDSSVPEEDRRYVGAFAAHRVLPHRMQDSFNREKMPRKFVAAVLENELVRATVLPELGGRLISIFHKPTGRELLERPVVFQPANLALRSAWFSGGIEWNTSQFGHYYLTCSPVFAAQVTGLQGEPVLRIYEWDRAKCFTWQIDFHLPPGSPLLFARMRIVNPHGVELPMYWWTNMAVPERPDVRVLVPAATAFYHDEQGLLKLGDLPNVGGYDMSYVTNASRANEYYFRIPYTQRRWVAALGADGAGFFQTSTDRLRGRKLFCWGMNQGGRRWQEYLSEPGRGYLEIQGGLSCTQAESIPMPPNTEWSWTEAYGLVEANPGKVHSKDWDQAWTEVDRALGEILPRTRLDELDAQLAEVTARPPDRILHRGSGWGALERMRLRMTKDEDRIPGELIFDEADLGAEQAMWISLLEKGVLPTGDSGGDPGEYMVQPQWRTLLERALADGCGDHWLSWLHLGIMRLEARDEAGARSAWGRSVELQPSGWAYRNLALLASRQRRAEEACDLMRRAWETGPRIAPLVVEYGESLLKNERFDALGELLGSLPDDIRGHERILILRAKLALKSGDFRDVDEVLSHEFACIREGETTLSDLWFAVHEQRVSATEGIEIDEEFHKRIRREFPPPRMLDFRMLNE